MAEIRYAKAMRNWKGEPWFEYIEFEEYRGYTFKVCNVFGDYPLCVIETFTGDLDIDALSLPGNPDCSSQNVAWRHDTPSDRYGDRRMGKEWTTEELVEETKAIIDKIAAQRPKDYQPVREATLVGFEYIA